MPKKRPIPEKCGVTVYTIYHDRLISAHIWRGGGAEWGQGVGGKTLYLQNIEKVRSEQKQAEVWGAVSLLLVAQFLTALQNPSRIAVGKSAHRFVGRSA
jgi:hypothetical protein